MPDPVQPEPLPEEAQPQPERLSARKRSWRKRLGDAGERDAARMLAQKGYTILLRDCRTPKGELDLVCLDGAAYVFVEVKTRYCHFHRWGSSLPEPWRGLSEAQKLRIRRGAISFLHDLGERASERLYRFDLVEVLRGPFGPVREGSTLGQGLRTKVAVVCSKPLDDSQKFLGLGVELGYLFDLFLVS